MFEDFAQKLVGLSQSPGWQQGLNQIAALRPMTKSQAAIDASQAQTRLQERETGIKEQQAQRELLQGETLIKHLYASSPQERAASLRAYIAMGGDPRMIEGSQLLQQQATEEGASQDYMNTYGKGSTLPPIEGQLPPLGGLPPVMGNPMPGGSMPPASPPPMPMPPAGQQMPPQAPMQAPPMQQPQPTVMAPEVQPPAITGATTPATSDIGAAEARLRAANTARIKALQQKEAAERTGNQAFVGEASAVVLQAEAAKEQAKIEYDRAKELADKSQIKIDKIEEAKTAPMNEFQAKSNIFAQRMLDAEPVLTQFGPVQGINPKESGLREVPLGLGNYFMQSETQQLDQAERNFLNAVLRQESGAVIGPTEFTSGIKQYFPRPGDQPEVIKQKAENRKTAIKGMQDMVGPSYKPPAPPKAVPPALAAAGITAEDLAEYEKGNK